MHASLQQLAELRLQLRRLPGYAPPAEAWQSIQRRLTPAARPAPANARSLRTWAVATALAPLCFVAVFWSLRHGSDPANMAVPAGNIDALVARSQQLESMLQQLPPRPAVEHAATSATIDALQSRIQLLDSTLSADGEYVSTGPDAQRLWSQRVQLMNSLVGMRYAEAVRVGYQTNNHAGVM